MVWRIEYIIEGNFNVWFFFFSYIMRIGLKLLLRILLKEYKEVSLEGILVVWRVCVYVYKGKRR